MEEAESCNQVDPEVDQASRMPALSSQTLIRQARAERDRKPGWQRARAAAAITLFRSCGDQSVGVMVDSVMDDDLSRNLAWSRMAAQRPESLHPLGRDLPSAVDLRLRLCPFSLAVSPPLIGFRSGSRTPLA